MPTRMLMGTSFLVGAVLGDADDAISRLAPGQRRAVESRRARPLPQAAEPSSRAVGSSVRTKCAGLPRTVSRRTPMIRMAGLGVRVVTYFLASRPSGRASTRAGVGATKTLLKLLVGLRK